MADATGDLAHLARLTVAETVAARELAGAVPESVLELRSRQAETLGLIAKDDGVATTLLAEQCIMQNELDRVATDKVRVSSLNAGLTEAAAALHVHDILQNEPDAYRTAARLWTLQKNLRGDLPDDEARQFFESHRTRLMNDKRSRYSDSEIAVLDARLAALSAAEQKYIALQRQVLGLAPPPQHPKSTSSAP